MGECLFSFKLPLLDFENKSADSAIILFKEILKRGFVGAESKFR